MSPIVNTQPPSASPVQQPASPTPHAGQPQAATGVDIASESIAGEEDPGAALDDEVDPPDHTGRPKHPA